MSELSSKVIVNYIVNELDVRFITPYGEGDSNIPSRLRIPSRSNFASSTLIDWSNDKHISKAYVRYRNDLSSSLVIPYHNELDVVYDFILPPQTTSTIGIVQDTFVREARPTLNYGTNTVLSVGRPLEGRLYTVMKVDLRYLSTLSNVQYTAFKLNMSLIGDSTNSLSIYTFNGDWQENSLTWNALLNYGKIFIKDVEVGSGRVSIDLYEFVLNQISSGNYIFNLLITTDVERIYSIYSRENDSDVIPTISVTYFDTTWAGNVGKNSLNSQITVRAYKTSSFYSQVKVVSFGDYASRVFISDPTNRLSFVNVSRPDILSKLVVPYLYLFNSSVSVVGSGLFNLSAQVGINRLQLPSNAFVIGHGKSEFSSQLRIRNEENTDISSNVSVNRDALLSSVRLTVYTDFNSSLTIRREDRQEQDSVLIVTKDSFISTLTILPAYNVNSQAFVVGVNESLLDSHTAVSRESMYSRVSLKINSDFNGVVFVKNLVPNDINSQASIVGIGRSDLNSSAIISRKLQNDLNSIVRLRLINNVNSQASIVGGGVSDLNSNTTVLYKAQNDLNSTVRLRLNDDLNSQASIIGGGRSDLNSRSIVSYKLYNDLNSIVRLRLYNDINSSTLIRVYGKTDFNSFVNLSVLSEHLLESSVMVYSVNDFSSLVDILNASRFNSQAIIRQLNVSEILSSVFVETEENPPYLLSKVSVRTKAVYSLTSKIEVQSSARFWKPNTYGALNYRRKLPI